MLLTVRLGVDSNDIGHGFKPHGRGVLLYLLQQLPQSFFSPGGERGEERERRERRGEGEEGGEREEREEGRKGGVMREW